MQTIGRRLCWGLRATWLSRWVTMAEGPQQGDTACTAALGTWENQLLCQGTASHLSPLPTVPHGSQHSRAEE